MDEQLTIDELNRRLAQVQDRLLELGPDDHAERYRLKVEQDQLRSQARRFAKDRDADRSTEDLKAELRARERALKKVRRKLMNAAAQAGGGGGGSGSFEGPLDAFKINNALMSGTDAEALIRRIARLETILGERGAL